MILKIIIFCCLFLNIALCQNKDCIPPECARPNINNTIGLILEFCVLGNDSSCFSEIELAEIVITSRFKNTETIFRTDTINQNYLRDQGHTVTIGLGTQIFLADPGQNPKAIEENQFDYQIEILPLRKKYIINNLLITKNAVPCKCPEYKISSLNLNGTPFSFNEGIVQIKISSLL